MDAGSVRRWQPRASYTSNLDDDDVKFTGLVSNSGRIWPEIHALSELFDFYPSLSTRSLAVRYSSVVGVAREGLFEYWFHFKSVSRRERLTFQHLNQLTVSRDYVLQNDDRFNDFYSIMEVAVTEALEKSQGDQPLANK
jgi:hypothetical protein